MREEQSLSLGWILALIVIVLAIVSMALGHLRYGEGGLILLLGIARLC